MHILRTEKSLWEHIKPDLAGRRWRRLENAAGSGAGDAFGFFRGQTQWIELKVGLPALNKLRPTQHDFALDCVASGIPVWLCFAHRGKVLWFEGVDFTQPTIPPFYHVGLRRRLA